MSSVELIDIEKHFGDTHVVKGVSITVDSGEFLVLVGPSGCGKSTCLRMIAGLEDPTSGEIRIDGKVVNPLPPKDRDVAMVFQSYALYPHMTVRENLAFGLTLRRIGAQAIEDRVAEVARMLELSELLDRLPRQMSGGQRQRVAIGRAIARQPRAFLFDEPLSNLDAALRVQMRGEIAGLHRRLGTTMVYVTHDQVEAMTLANRIAVLDQGVLQQVATPMELYTRPANRFVAGFIGSPAMNFIEGEISNGGVGVRFRGAGIEFPVPAGDGIEAGKVTLGVRPHDLAGGDDGAIRGIVAVVEPMGWEAFAHVETDAGTLVARLDARMAGRIKSGETLALAIDADRSYLFDAGGRAVRFPRVDG